MRYILAAALALASLSAIAAPRHWVQWKGAEVYIDVPSIVEGEGKASFDYTTDFKSIFAVEVDCAKDQYTMTDESGDAITAYIVPNSPLAGIAAVACNKSAI